MKANNDTFTLFQPVRIVCTNTLNYPTEINSVVLRQLKSAESFEEKADIFYEMRIGFESSLIHRYFNLLELSSIEEEDILYCLKKMEENES